MELKNADFAPNPAVFSPQNDNALCGVCVRFFALKVREIFHSNSRLGQIIFIHMKKLQIASGLIFVALCAAVSFGVRQPALGAFMFVAGIPALVILQVLVVLAHKEPSGYIPPTFEEQFYENP